MQHFRSLGLAVFAAVALLLAACGTSPSNGGGGGGLTPDQVTGEINSSINAIAAAAMDLQFDPALQAFQSSEFNAFFGSTGGTFSLMALASDPTSMFDAILPTADQNLPRGVWTYEANSGAWSNTAASDDLVLVWTYPALDAEAGTMADFDAELTLDWNNSTSLTGSATTVDVVTDISTGTTAEVPTAIRILLELGPAGGTLTTGADLVMTFHWYDACAATGSQPIFDPTAFSLNGHVGFADAINFTDVTFGIDDAAGEVTSSGAVEVTTEDASASFVWDLDLNGEIQRTNCYVSNIAITDGFFSFTTSTTSDAETNTFAFTVNFDNLVIDAGTGVLVSADIDGSVAINGASAFEFRGTLDDENGNGVLGDNVTLTFSDGSTANLEAYLQFSLAATSR